MKHCFRTSAALAMALAMTALTFPVQAEVHNNAWHATPEPETCAEVGAYSTKAVVIRDASQLHRVVSNIEQLNYLRGYADSDAGLSLSLELPDVADADALAAQVAADKAAADAAAAVAAQAAALAAGGVPPTVATPEVPAAAAATAPHGGGGKHKR